VLIDPFTLGAQIVNFLILVWLLRRLLYGPITRAMAAREARIREELDDAARLRAEAEAEGTRYRELVAAFEANQTTRLAEARADLERWRKEHTQAVRAEVEAVRDRWQQALQQEKDAFLLELRRRAGDQILDVARRALSDLGDADLESHVTARFLTEIRSLTSDARAQLMTAAETVGHRIQVRTASRLDAAARQRLQDELANVLGRDLAVEFDTSPALVAGVELRAGGYKVAWSVHDYLQSLEDAVAETFGAGPEAVDDRR
jgi:F-type H+-transporting ATPase subunit b